MKTILAPIDFSDATAPVLETASALARAFPAKIVLVHVIRPAVIINAYSPEVAGLEIQAEAEESTRLLYWQQELRNDGIEVETSELYGEPASCIREECKKRQADFIVLGSHGHGAIYELLIGSTAAELLKRAPCPVLIVPVQGIKPEIEKTPLASAH